MSSLALLRSRRFGPFFATQLLGAFNDNLFKNALVVLLAFRVASSEQTDVWVQLAGGLFILPFFLFSAWAGRITDAVDKSTLIRAVKIGEIGIMILGGVAFALDSAVLLMGVLFLMGTQSALFGPVKYSLLPQHLREHELVTGNGLVESATFAAILLGTIAGGLLMGLGPQGVWLVSAAVIVVAVLGWLASRGIPPAPAPEGGTSIRFRPVRQTHEVLRTARANRSVWLAILAISWFWFYGALFLGQFPGYARHVLGGDEAVVTLLLAAFSIGIGAGSLLCARVSRGRIDLGLVPLGALGLAAFAADLAWATPPVASDDLGVGGFLLSMSHLRLLTDLTLIGICGGLYIVPLYAQVQHRADAAHRSRVIAANNIVNALFMVAAAGVAIALRKLGATTPQLFAVTGAATLVVAVLVAWSTPEALLRLAVRGVMRTMYRLRRRGITHIPERGPALLVCNHVSFVDALVLAAVVPRPVRFVMDRGIFANRALRWVFRTARAIPIASKRHDPAMRERAFEEVASALRNEELICIFPEGRLTTDGELGAFQRGLERIVRETPVPVVPLALHGLWGSFFSRKYGRAMSRAFPRPPRARVRVVCGAPTDASDATAEHMQRRVERLLCGRDGERPRRFPPVPSKLEAGSAASTSCSESNGGAPGVGPKEVRLRKPLATRGLGLATFRLEVYTRLPSR